MDSLSQVCCAVLQPVHIERMWPTRPSVPETVAIERDLCGILFSSLGVVCVHRIYHPWRGTTCGWFPSSTNANLTKHLYADLHLPYPVGEYGGSKIERWDRRRKGRMQTSKPRMKRGPSAHRRWDIHYAASTRYLSDIHPLVPKGGPYGPPHRRKKTHMFQT